MSFSWSPSAADRRLLPEGRLAGPMPWVIAIMIFLTVLAAAAGMGLGSAARGLNEELAGRVTIQVIEPDPNLREAQAAAVAQSLRSLSSVSAVRRVGAGEIAALLEPWLGGGAVADGLPLPALIDVDLTRTDARSLDELRELVDASAPSARIDAHARWLAPLARLIDTLGWLVLALVLLMAGATGAAVVLAARAALNTHRSTIDVLHLLGATDIQIARLFQRRIALDALFGGAVGFVAGVLVLVLLGIRLGAVGSELVGSVRLGPGAWLLLLCVPIAGVLLATVAARLTVVRALKRIL